MNIKLLSIKNPHKVIRNQDKLDYGERRKNKAMTSSGYHSGAGAGMILLPGQNG